jgi:hypothetical protein
MREVTSTVGGSQNMAEQAGTHEGEGEDWAKLGKQLFTYCRRKHHLPIEDAKQISQQAICRAIDQTLPGRDRHRYPTMILWLGSIVNGLVVNLRRNLTSKSETVPNKELPETTSIEGVAGVASAPRTPEEIAIAGERTSNAITRVLELLRGDALAERVVLLMLDKLDKPEAQAKELNVDVRKVYRAREKIAAATKHVKTEMERG